MMAVNVICIMDVPHTAQLNIRPRKCPLIDHKSTISNKLPLNDAELISYFSNHHQPYNIQLMLNNT